MADLSTETILKELHQRGVSSVFVEGGLTVHQSFFESGNWDEIRRFVSSESIGQARSSVENYEQSYCRRRGWIR